MWIKICSNLWKFVDDAGFLYVDKTGKVLYIEIYKKQDIKILGGLAV